jgi:hypothetical protein
LLWAWPEALPEFNLAREVADDRCASSAVARRADLAMGTGDLGQPEPRRLRLTREAEDAIEEFAREMARRSEEATGGFASALGKARGHALRLATVLQFLWWCGTADAREPDGISEEAITAAAALLDAYFVPMSERVFGDAAIPIVERGVMAVARHLRKAQVPEFNARTLRREIGGLVREASAMDGACKVLVEGGLIRPRFSRMGSSKGRRAQNYKVNSVLLRTAS